MANKELPFFRVTIRMTSHEMAALRELAEKSMRPTKDHMRWILVEECRRHGLLDVAGRLVETVAIDYSGS